jgi:hypothetical protein
MRIKIFCAAFLLLMLNVFALFAQPTEPCAGADPDTSCPLDTWVIILAAVALAFAAIHLYRKHSDLNNEGVTNTIKNGEPY